MFKLSYETLNNSEFTMALEKLANVETFNVKAAYNVGKIRDKVKAELNEAHPLFMKLIKKHAVLDENGEVLQAPGRGYEIRKEAQADFDKEWDEFMSIEVEIPRHKVTLSDIEAAMNKISADHGEKLSGKELAALDPILNHMETVEAQGAAS